MIPLKIKWKHRGAKLLSVFFIGYGGGFGVSLPANYIYAPDAVNWGMVFILPLISGLVTLFPQLGKMFGDMADGN